MNGSCFSGYKARSILPICAIFSILMALCFQMGKNTDIVSSMKDMIVVTSLISTIFVFCEIVLRLWNFLAQITDGRGQYDTDCLSALSSSFEFNTATIIIIVLNVILVIILVFNGHGIFTYIDKFSLLTCIPCIMIAWILLRITNLSNFDLQGTSVVSSMKGLDYGTGMAYSYYYGYLKLILPSTGTITKGLLEKIENVEDAHNITLASQKLIILMPSSSYISPDLKTDSYQWMESAIELEEERRDRAGVKKRSYRNNIYKIYDGGRNSGSPPQYVVIEGATPLLTFYEVQKHMHPETKVYKKYHKQVVRAFYEKLKELLYNDLDCRYLCELIYYDDYDSDGNKVNVAKVILQRLSKMTNTN